MKRRSMGLKLLAMLGVTLGFTAVGVALAQWLASGDGEGRATAGVSQGLTLTPGTPSTLLFPGGTGDVAVTVSNPNPFPVEVASFALDGTITSDTLGCDPSNHGVTFTDQAGIWTVPGSGSLDVNLAGAVAMAADSAAACQGANFTVPLAADGGSGGGDPGLTWFQDADADGFGDPLVSQQSPTQPPDSWPLQAIVTMPTRRSTRRRRRCSPTGSTTTVTVRSTRSATVTLTATASRTMSRMRTRTAWSMRGRPIRSIPTPTMTGCSTGSTPTRSTQR